MHPTIPTKLDAKTLAVATHAVVKRYDKRDALLDLHLTVPHGAVYALVGRNGSGKTTAFKILLDLVRPDSGRAEVHGLDVRQDGTRVRARIGYVPERPDLGPSWMRVGDLLRHHSTYFRNWDTDYAQRLSHALELRGAARFRDLSKGEARRVQLVMALAHRPALLLLDEPNEGLDPVARQLLQEILVAHVADSPTTVLLATHLIHAVDGVADHLGVLHDGRLLVQTQRDDLHQLLRRYRASVPHRGWSGANGLEAHVLERRESAREITWTVWGEEGEVVNQLQTAGAQVQSVSALTLEEAAVALLGGRSGRRMTFADEPAPSER
jgi:ABC-2 type transport system ATP-binding protein